MNKQKNTSFLIKPSQSIFGEAEVLGDKSITHRSLILASLAKGKTKITNALMGEDNLATLKAFNQMGVQSQIIDENTIEIEGVGFKGLSAPKSDLNLGNSGTGIRLLTGVLAAQNFASTLVGDESIMSRPMARVAIPLAQMNAKVELKNNENPPIKIKPSQLKGSEINLKLASAQVKSAIMFAALYAQDKTTIHFSEKTRDHTEVLFNYLGIKIECSDNQICIYPQKADFLAKDIEVAGDISSASFLIAGALLSKPGENLVIKNVGINPTRISVLEILKMMGARIELINQTKRSNELIADIKVYPSNLSGIEIPKNLVAGAIDEFPVLMVLAAFAKGKTKLKNAIELRYKESDRISSVICNLRILGIECEEFEDGMSIEGLGDFPAPYHYKTIKLDSCADHRIAMAFSLAALKMKQDIEIKNCNNVDTSFPNYVDLMKKIGLKISKKSVS